MDTATVVAILKWLFPSIVGSVLAVYYKAKEVGWANVPTQDKIKLVLLGIGSISLGCFVAYILGGVLIEWWGISTQTKLYLLIYLIVGFSGTKLVDATAKNLDEWINKITETITIVIDNFLGRFK